MNKKEVLQFIQDNEEEKLLDFYNKTYDKLKDLNRRLDKLTLFLIIIVFIYFLSSANSPMSKIQIGPFEITDPNVTFKLLPLVFSYLLFDLVLSSNHRSEMIMAVKLVFHSLYKDAFRTTMIDGTSISNITMVIMPFGYSMEMLKHTTSSRSVVNSCIGVLLVLPLSTMIFLPFVFEFYLLKVLYNNYYNDLFGKLCFWLSIYISIYLFYIVINSIIISYKNQQLEKEEKRTT